MPPLIEQSFMKALFHGVIAEDMIFPYPEMPAEDRENTSMILDSVRRFFASSVDPAKIDREHTIGPEADVDVDVVGGAHEVGFHFLGHRNDAVAHDLRDDGVDFASVALPAPVSLRAFGARLARGGLGLLRHDCHRPTATLITRFPKA